MHVLISNIQIFKHYSLLIVLTLLTKKTPSWLWSLTGRKQGHVVSEVKEYHSPSAWAFWILLIHQQRTSQVLRVRQMNSSGSDQTSAKAPPLFWLLRWMFYKDPKTAWLETWMFNGACTCSLFFTGFHLHKQSLEPRHVAPNMLQGWTKVP